MPNMSYCRFENTYNDLMDCYNNMEKSTFIPKPLTHPLYLLPSEVKMLEEETEPQENLALAKQVRKFKY